MDTPFDTHGHVCLSGYFYGWSKLDTSTDRLPKKYKKDDMELMKTNNKKLDILWPSDKSRV